MDGIGEEVIDWRDPLRPHAFYDLTKDADKILEGIDIENKCIFSQVRESTFISYPIQLAFALTSFNSSTSFLVRRAFCR